MSDPARPPGPAAPSPAVPAIATVVSGNRVSQARVLADSLRHHHPELDLEVLVSDRPDPAHGHGPAGYRARRFESLEAELPPFSAFRQCRQGLAVLCKYALMRRLLAEGAQSVLFLDPDMLVLGRLDSLLQAVASHSVLLLPHVTRPPAGPGRIAGELTLLQLGVFNGGCVGVCAGEEASAFLDWMIERLAMHIGYRPGQAIHFDQTWLSLVPGIFGASGVFRDPAYNVAYWNLPQRADLFDRVGSGDGVRLFHFSGFDPEHPDRATRHRNALGQVAPGPAAALHEDYAARLLAAGWRAEQVRDYGFGRFSNGAVIDDRLRALHHAAGAQAEDFGDPFDAAGETGFVRWLGEPVDAERPLIHRCWIELWHRTDALKARFADPMGADRARFSNWMDGADARPWQTPRQQDRNALKPDRAGGGFSW